MKKKIVFVCAMVALFCSLFCICLESKVYALDLEDDGTSEVVEDTTTSEEETTEDSDTSDDVIIEDDEEESSVYKAIDWIKNLSFDDLQAMGIGLLSFLSVDTIIKLLGVIIFLRNKSKQLKESETYQKALANLDEDYQKKILEIHEAYDKKLDELNNTLLLTLDSKEVEKKEEAQKQAEEIASEIQKVVDEITG